jgi:hypothetical protein
LQQQNSSLSSVDQPVMRHATFIVVSAYFAQYLEERQNELRAQTHNTLPDDQWIKLWQTPVKFQKIFKQAVKMLEIVQLTTPLAEIGITDFLEKRGYVPLVLYRYYSRLLHQTCRECMRFRRRSRM